MRTVFKEDGVGGKLAFDSGGNSSEVVGSEMESTYFKDFLEGYKFTMELGVSDIKGKRQDTILLVQDVSIDVDYIL